jgi:hypothetical protein
VPDRIAAAADLLNKQAAALHDDLEKFRVSQRRKNIAFGVIIALLAAVIVAVVLIALDRSNTNDRNALERCQTTNDGRQAIKEAFADSNDTLEGVIEGFVNPDSDDGQRFLATLKAEHAASEARLATKLPTIDCTA